MKQISCFYILIICLLFLGSSFVFGVYSLPLFSLIGYVLAFFYYLVSRAEKFYKEWQLLSLYFIISAVSIISTLSYSEYDSINITVNTFLGMLLGLCFCIIFKHFIILYSEFQRKLVCALKITLVVSLIFLYIQFFGYFIFGHNIDYMKPVTGEPQRLFGYVQHIYGYKFQRVSGFFAEPAVYAFITNVLMISIIRHKAMPMWLFILSVCSVFLTFSASGIMLAIIPVTIYFFSISKQKKCCIILLLLMIIGIYHSELYNLFGQQFDRMVNFQTDPSAASRLDFIKFFDSHLDVFLFGYGVFADLKALVPPAAFLTSMIYNFGVFLSVIILIPMLYSAYKQMFFFDFVLFCFFALILNYPNASPFFWFIYSVLYVSLSKNSIVKENLAVKDH